MLNDPRIDIYTCGREDIRTGQIDRRVLATLEYLADSGLGPRCRRSSAVTAYLTTSGNVSEHSSGNAVDIAAINGTPILDHQGRGSITDITIQRLLRSGDHEAAPDHQPDDAGTSAAPTTSWRCPTTTTTSTSASTALRAQGGAGAAQARASGSS